jgi:hypothetical protein
MRQALVMTLGFAVLSTLAWFVFESIPSNQSITTSLALIVGGGAAALLAACAIPALDADIRELTRTVLRRLLAPRRPA